MNTPRKNENYASPYDTPMHQYPSQSEDYLSLQIGGPGSNRKAQTPYKQQHRGRGRYSSTPAKNNQDGDGGGGGSGSGGGGASVPYFYQNKQQMGGRGGGGGGQNRFNSGNGGNNRNSYGGNGGGRQNYQQQNRWSNNGGGGRGGGQRNFRQSFNKDDISSYFHPTMLEDPWLELMERHNAIRRSEINLQTSSTQERKLREDSSDDEKSETQNMEEVAAEENV